jgi:pyridoxal/pyridoxine/pyridoxamine kinase
MALFAGRYCLVNTIAGLNPGMRSLFHVADSDEDIIHKVHSLMNDPFTERMIQERKTILSGYFDNTGNARKIIELMQRDLRPF